MHRHLTYPIAGFALAALAACGDEVAVVEPPPTLTIVTESLPPAFEDQPYLVELVAQGGAGEELQWSLVEETLPGGLFLTNEGILHGTPRQGGSFDLEVRVRDGEGIAVTRAYTLEVEAAPPAVTIDETTLPPAFLSQPYTATITASNGMGLEWRVARGDLPPGIRLEGGTDERVFLRGVPTEAQRYSFTIRVIDAARNRVDASFVIDVEDTSLPLEIINEPPLQATATRPYEHRFVARGGSERGYLWEVVGGDLPEGLVLESEGTPSVLLSGTPTRPNTNPSFTLRVVDSEGNFDTAIFSIFVEAPPDPVRIVTFEIPGGRVGETYRTPIRAVNGSEQGLVWTILDGALPRGLTLAPAGAQAPLQAVIEGEPEEAGQFDFTVRVTDDLGFEDDQIYSLLIQEAIIPVEIDDSAAINGIIVLSNAEGGQPYGEVLRARDGAPLPPTAPDSEVRYNWVVTGGSLPPGLSLNPAGREPDYAATFSGLPSALGTYTASVTVYDRLNQTDTVVIQISVDPPTTPLVITTTSLEPLASSGCYSDILTATGGGNTGYQWEVAQGALPAGYELSSTGTPFATLFGVPEVTSGTFPVTIRVTDTFGNTDTQDLTLEVDPSKPGSARWGVTVGDADIDNQIDAYVVDLCGDEPGEPIRVNRTLTNGDVRYFTGDIFISPRGNALAFIGDLDVDNRFDVYLVDLRDTPAPGAAINIYNGRQPGLDAQDILWSPDGSKIAIWTDHNSSSSEELWVADVSDLSNPRPAVRVSQQGFTSAQEVYSTDYAFSPDGTKIAWVGDNEFSGRDYIYVVDLSGPTPSAPVTAHRTPSNTSMDVNGMFLWTPDSRGIVFNADFNVLSQDELFYTDVSGAPPYTETVVSGVIQSSGDVQTNFYADRPQNFEFSPDGDQLFFIGDLVNDAEEDIFLLGYANGVFTGRTALTQISQSTGRALDAKWSPDGDRLLVRGDMRASGSYEMFILDVGGSTPITTFTPLRQGAGSLGMGTSDFDYTDEYDWSPDGSKVAFIGDFQVSSSREIYFADVSGLPPYSAERLNAPHSSSAQQIWEFRFSPDSQRLAFFGDNRSSFDELFVVDLRGATPGTPVQAHTPFTSTSLDVYENTDEFDNAWFWTGPETLILRGDLEVAFDDRAWIVDVSGEPPYTPQVLAAPGQFGSASLMDIFFLAR